MLNTGKGFNLAKDTFIQTYESDTLKAIKASETRAYNDKAIPKENRFLDKREFNILYRQFESQLTAVFLPISPLDKLKEYKSCIPPNHGRPDDLLTSVSTSIYNRLLIRLQKKIQQ